MRRASTCATAKVSACSRIRLRQGFAAVGGKLLRIVQADDPARGIQDDRCGDHRPEERAATDFVNPGDAQPAALPRFAFVAGTAKPPHRRAF